MAPTETDTDPVVLRRVFPAEVVTPDGRVLTNALVYVTEADVRVWQDGGNTPELVFESTYLTDGSVFTPDALLKRHPLSLLMPDGQSTVLVNRGRGCGCQLTTLKAYRPYVPERHGSTR